VKGWISGVRAYVHEKANIIVAHIEILEDGGNQNIGCWSTSGLDIRTLE